MTTTLSLSWPLATDNHEIDHYEVFANGESTPSVTTTGTSGTVTGLVPGSTNTLQVVAVDPSGNRTPGTSIEQSMPFLVPPTLTDDTPYNWVGLRQRITFADDAAWRGAIVSVTVDGAPIAADEYAVAAGELLIDGSVFDHVGDYGVAVAATTYLDATCTVGVVANPGPPATTASGIPDGWATSGPVTFALEATGVASPVSTLYALNGGELTTYTAPVEVGTEGTTTVSYFSTDAAGQVEATLNATIRIDTGKPVTTITGVSEGGVYTDPASVPLTAADGVSGIDATYYLLDSDPTTHTYSAAVGVSGSGAHSVTYWSADPAGNIEVARTVHFNVSTAPPVTTAAGIPGGWSTSAPVTFTLTPAGDGAPFSTYYALDAGELATYTAPVGVSTQGTTTLSYLSVDAAAQRESTRTATIRIDTAGPVTSIDGLPHGGIATAPVTFSLSCADPVSGPAAGSIRYVLDSVQPTVTYTMPVQVTTPGPHTVLYWAKDVAGNKEAARIATFTIAAEAVRVSGSNRYDTAARISASAFATGSADAVVIATGENFPDALCAAGLAGAVKGPVLLTRKDALPSSLMTEALRVTQGATTRTAHLIGSGSVVASSVADQLAAAGFVVERHFGADRYATAADVAAAIESIEGTGFAHTAFVARGDTFPDALAVGPFAYSQGFPILLTRSGDLPAVTSGTITALGITDVVIPGSASAVSTGVADALDALTGVNTPVRAGGATRYDTAIAVVEHAMAQGWGDASYIGVATGRNYPDALAGGPVAGASHGVMLLTDPDVLSAQTAAFLTAHKAEVGSCVVYGGTTAVTEPVRDAIAALLR